MDHDHRLPEGLNRRDRAFKWMFGGFLLVALFFLLTEHRAHLFGILPWLLVLACPLMHLFGHGHGGHRHQNSGGPGSRQG